MKEIILAYQGEMSLKGLNRATFESVLLKTMRRRLKSLGNFKIYKAQSTMYAEPAGDEDIDAAEERIGKIFGIAAISRAAVCPKDFAVIADTAKEYLCGALRAAKTFKVSAKRSDKTFPMDSMEIARELGGVLLSLPCAAQNGRSIGLGNGLFTATSAVCVTGLVVVPTFSYWTLFGKIVILALIQLGGLGIVALTSFVMLLMNRKFSLRNRMMIQDAFGLSTMQGMVVFIKRVIKGTVIVEMLGAVLYMFAFIPQFGVAHGIWYSVFNAISTFCNAGIDIIGPDSLMTYADSPLVLLTSSFLIICGGLGFVVWWDVVDVLSNVRAKKIPARDIWRRFNTHTKIILMMTFALILSGMVVTFLFECNNPLTLGNMSLGKKMLNAFFQSVTLRTAGFASISQKGLTEPTVLVSCVIMFVGGSPVGTAGGIKTMTAATLVFAVLAVVQGRKETVAFKKTIPTSIVRRSLAVTVIGFGTLILFSVLLLATNPLSLSDGVFEVTSAIATVGLSRDVTPGLNVIGKVIIIVCMYLGRVGPITMFMFFGQRATNHNSVKYADAEIIVG